MRAESRGHRWQWALLLLTFCLLALRLWHIRADFTDFHFYSQERARFTDEGFYTSAALHYFTLGRAYIPGGWNPGVFMPVWPLLVGLVFHFTGISVVAARSLAVVCTWVGVLLAYAVARQYRSQAFACLTAFLMAASALGFFYGRLAILEPSFVMFLLLAIYLAGKVHAGSYAMAAVVGLVFVAATLTKTTAPFLLPAVLYPIWANNRANRAAAWRMLAVSLAVIVLLLGCAKVIWLLHYSSDSKIILGLKPWWQLEHSPLRLLRFFFRGTWIDPVLFPLALAGVVAAAWRLRSCWHDTLFVTAVLWEAGYAAFIAFHYDGPPRYFVTLIAPTIWLALMFLEWMWQANKRVALAVSACVAASVLWNLASIGEYMLHPRYSLVDASVAIKHVIDAEHKMNPMQSELLIGRGADEISLLSGGLAAMDSDGAMPLAEKLDVYHPGWFMDWTGASPTLRMETVAAHRRLVKKAVYPDLDRYRHAGIVLYQILPRGSQ
ncbi:MAG TPA: glycosyltransferase family 39 protein [Acidobacteriaceae bacterium]|nr:glycosyltransferase family 39 protein [Acidobacteriaceae bacterium]